VSARVVAARALALVLGRGRALDVALDAATSNIELSPRDRGYAQALCFAALRHGRAYQVVLAQLVPKTPEPALLALLMISLGDLDALETAPFAAVNEAVSAARTLGLGHASGLVNAVVRRFSRDKTTLLAQAMEKSAQARSGLPSWLEHALRNAHAGHVADAGAFERSCAALQQPAPMWLRLDPRAGTAVEFTAQFAAEFAAAEIPVTLFAGLPQALKIASMPVARIPGFLAGDICVQDGAAQLAAMLLAPQNGEQVLDACAAPGGKTAHLLALAPDCAITAVDNDAQRLTRVTETLARVHAAHASKVQILACDAANLPKACTNFDAILLDAPCSATGVIRRHPDIAWLRRETDIAKLVHIQRQLLDALWRRLRPGGRLLYATCSIIHAENGAQIAAFLARTPDARSVPFPTTLDWFGAPGAAEQPGGVTHTRQNLPGEHDMDGFFYALLHKFPVCSFAKC
jgi:16S rRNA (cytosine967-C5)-methyltransferase